MHTANIRNINEALPVCDCGVLYGEMDRLDSVAV